MRFYTNSDEMNVFITLTARSLSPHIEIIARVVKNSNKRKYFLAGADFAFSADETIGLMGTQYIDQPISYAVLDEMLTENTGVLFESIKILEHSFYMNRSIETLDLNEKKLLLFGVVRKGEKEILSLPSYPIGDKTFYFNPPLDFVLANNDILIIMGKKHHIKNLRKQSDKRPLQ